MVRKTLPNATLHHVGVAHSPKEGVHNVMFHLDPYLFSLQTVNF